MAVQSDATFLNLETDAFFVMMNTDLTSPISATHWAHSGRSRCLQLKSVVTVLSEVYVSDRSFTLFIVRAFIQPQSLLGRRNLAVINISNTVMKRNRL